MWRIQLLGKTRAFYEERACTDITPTETLLLAFLALAPKRALARSELVKLLWRDEDCWEDLSHRLRQTLFKLKNKLRNEFHSDSLLLVQKETIALNSEAVVDVTEFEAAVLEAQRTADLPIEEEHLCRAIQLYGGQFLPQHLSLFGAERERLNRQYSNAQERLAELAALSSLRLPPAVPLPGKREKNESPAVPAAPRFPAKTNRGRYRRTTMGLLCLGALICIVWAMRRLPVVPTAPLEITPANIQSVLEELNRLQTNPAKSETAEARSERLRRHAELCVQLLEAVEARFWGPEEQIWQRCLIETAPSQKMAFDWCLKHDSEKALQMSGVLAMHWFRNAIKGGDGREARTKLEGRQWIEAALKRSPNSRSPAKARALRRYTLLAYDEEAIRHTRTLIDYAAESLEICRQQHREKEELESLRLLAIATAAHDQQHEALQQYEQILEKYRGLGDKTGEAHTYLCMAHLGDLKLPAPVCWTRNAAWARKSLALYRSVNSQCGIQRALNIYQSTVESLEHHAAAKNAAVKTQWNRWLLEDYCIEVQRAESMNSDLVVAHRKRILSLAASLQDRKIFFAQLLWFHRRWNRFRSNLSSEEWAQLSGCLLHFNPVLPASLISKEERLDLIAEGKAYRSNPHTHSAFQAGSAMGLKEASDFVSRQP